MWQKSIKYLDKALELNKEVFGEKHPEVSLFYSNKAQNLNKLGKTIRAIDHQKKSLFIYEQLFPQNNAHRARCLNNLGLLLKDAGEYGEALICLKKAQPMLSKTCGEEHKYYKMCIKAIEECNFGIIESPSKRQKIG